MTAILAEVFSDPVGVGGIVGSSVPVGSGVTVGFSVPVGSGVVVGSGLSSNTVIIQVADTSSAVSDVPLVAVTVIIAFPGAIVVKLPFWSTITTFSSLVFQTSVLSSAFDGDTVA